MKVVIIGGSGAALCVADAMTDAHNRFGVNVEVIGFALDDRSHGESIGGYPIVCGVHEAFARFGEYNDVQFAFLLYRADVLHERVALRESLGIPRSKYCNFVHPTAYVARSVKLGVGNVVAPFAIIDSNVTIGDFNVVRGGVFFGHDTIVGNSNFFAAHTCVGSAVKIGSENFFGLNCTLKNGKVFGNNVIIGMASNVVKDVVSGSLVYGNPASPKSHLNHPIR